MKKLMVSFIDGISNKRVVTVHSLYRPKTDASFSRNLLENSPEIFFFPFVYLFIFSFFWMGHFVSCNGFLSNLFLSLSLVECACGI